MKHLVLVFLASLVATTSHAVVADHFTCTATVEDQVGGTTTDQTQDFSMVRLPTSGGTTQPYDETMAGTNIHVRVNANHGILTANLRMYYRHAIREIPGSTGLEARQASCVGIWVGYCQKTADGPSCPDEDGQMACARTPTPFDPVNGWKKTSVIDGIAAFNDSEMAPAWAEIRKKDGTPLAKVTVNCKFLGTYK